MLKIHSNTGNTRTSKTINFLYKNENPNIKSFPKRLFGKIAPLTLAMPFKLKAIAPHCSHSPAPPSSVSRKKSNVKPFSYGTLENESSGSTSASLTTRWVNGWEEPNVSICSRRQHDWFNQMSITSSTRGNSVSYLLVAAKRPMATKMTNGTTFCVWATKRSQKKAEFRSHSSKYLTLFTNVISSHYLRTENEKDNEKVQENIFIPESCQSRIKRHQAKEIELFVICKHTVKRCFHNGMNFNRAT